MCFFSIFRKQSAVVAKRNLACNTHYTPRKKQPEKHAPKKNTVVAVADGSCFLIIQPCHIAQHNLVQTHDALLTHCWNERKTRYHLYRIIIVLCKLGNWDCACNRSLKQRSYVTRVWYVYIMTHLFKICVHHSLKYLREGEMNGHFSTCPSWPFQPKIVLNIGLHPPHETLGHVLVFFCLNIIPI